MRELVKIYFSLIVQTELNEHVIIVTKGLKMWLEYVEKCASKTFFNDTATDETMTSDGIKKPLNSCDVDD